MEINRSLQKKSRSMAANEEENCLPDDMVETILNRLPITDAVKVASVCKRWRALLVSSPSLQLIHANKPWLFLFGFNRRIISANKLTGWGFDPLALRWIRLPPLQLQSGGDEVDVREGNGVVFGILGGSRIRYRTEMVKQKWEETPPMRTCRNDPVVTLINRNNKLLLFVVGGVYSEFEEEYCSGSGEMYDASSGEWTECPPLPSQFKSTASSTCMSSALLHNDQIFIWEKYSGDCCCFHLETMRWGSVRKVRRPSGVRYSSLLACNDRFILAGLAKHDYGDREILSFNLWSVDQTSMECTHIACMPSEIFDSFFVINGRDDEDGEDVIKLECKAMGDLIYVFSHQDQAVHHSNLVACVCGLSQENGIVWQKVPSLAFPINPSDRMLCVCSPVTMSQFAFDIH